jgi:hypothetical protein
LDQENPQKRKKRQQIGWEGEWQEQRTKIEEQTRVV